MSIQRKIRRAGFVVLLILSATGGAAQDIGISAEISAASVAFEARDTLTVRLVWEGEPFVYQIDSFPMPGLEKFEILGSSSSVSTAQDSMAVSGIITTRTFSYVLSPVDFGTGVVQPLNLTAKNRVTGTETPLKTGRLTVEIARPVPKEESGSAGSAVVIVIALVVIFGGGIAAFLYIRRQRARKTDETLVDVRYLDALREIKKETIADRKLFYSRLYRLILQYLEKEHGLEVTAMTTEEVIAAVKGLKDENQGAVITTWLSRIQQEKYLPESTSADKAEALYNDVYGFFENELTKK